MISSFYGMFIFMEPFRLWLIYDGNLNEKVPNLSAAFLMSFWNLGIVCYIGGLQHRTGGGFFTPYEQGMCFVYVVLLIAQMHYGYKAARTISLSQTVGFYRTFDSILK